MQHLRIQEKNKINDEIRLLSKYNEHDAATMTRYRSASSTDKYAMTQLEKLQNQIQDRKTKLEIYEQRLLDVTEGKLDEELESVVQANMALANEKAAVTKQKKTLEKELKASDEKLYSKFTQQEKRNDRVDKAWYYTAALRYFDNASNSIPEYMSRELQRMPSNTGYIWKGVFCYGERPPNSNLFVFTENRKGMKIIHKWDSIKYEIFHKEGKQNEILISSKLKRRLFS